MDLTHCLVPYGLEDKDDEECPPSIFPSNISLVENFKSGFANVLSRTQLFETAKPPNIEHELNIAKSILQQCSGATGDNLFDHLADIIKIVMRENPDNIIDYFDEFSHNLRQQKFRNPERFTRLVYEPPDVDAAKAILHMLKVPIVEGVREYDVCKEEKFSKAFVKLPKEDTCPCKIRLNENVLRLNLYWALCGLGMQNEEVMYLACSLQKLQCQPNVEHCRFWGKIYGFPKSYYIVEVTLTQCELKLRLEKMKEEMKEMMNVTRTNSEETVANEVDTDLVPGFQWRDQPEEELNKMLAICKDIPKPKVEIKFDIPPEPVGTGLNRRTYFVVNSLNEEWIELPIVTPKQIKVSRKIKKFLTGDLETDILGYPKFPGTEKHYLRALIARITAGTYVAPSGYYRKLTKKEEMKALGEEIDEAEEEEIELFGEEEEEDFNNDAMITENSNYEPIATEQLMRSMAWVHYRPHILEQGRVVYFDEVGARKALERELLMRDLDVEQIIDEEEEEEYLEDEMDENLPISEETGPHLFSACSNDTNTEGVKVWTAKYSSNHNKVNQLVVMRSNVWPGAHSFTFAKFSDSIYIGSGFKYTARNMTIPHVPSIQYEYTPDTYQEATDPTVLMEQAWALYQLRKKRKHEVCVEEDDEDEEEEQEVC